MTNKQILTHPPQEVTFKAGDLVQVYRSDLNFTLATEQKLLPKFSAPRRIVNRNQNSYQLETLEGFPITGKFSSRRLRQFIPRQGTELERTQAIEEEWRRREEEDDRVGAQEEEGPLDEDTKTKDKVETRGRSQTPGPTCLDTSSNGSQGPCNEAVA